MRASPHDRNAAVYPAVADFTCKPKPRAQMRIMLLTFGLFILAMLVMHPVWDSVLRLNDVIYVQLVGEAQATITILGCFAVLALHLVLMTCFFLCADAGWHTELTMFNIGRMFILILGVMLLIISIVSSDDDTVNVELCKRSTPEVFDLFVTSRTLIAMRERPDCFALPSVDHCPGFTELTNHSERVGLAVVALRSMEDNLRCSGFCQGDTDKWLHLQTRLVAANPNATLLTLPHVFVHSNASSVTPLVSAVFGLDGPPAQQRPDATATTAAYPPTLFSKNNFQTSCDGQTRRYLMTTQHDALLMKRVQGVFLICAFIAIGFVLLCNKLALHPLPHA